MICGNMKLLNLLTALSTTKIQIRFAIIFLNPQNIQIELHDNQLTIRIYRVVQKKRPIFVFSPKPLL